MAVIPQGVTQLFESVVSYLYIVLLILVIVKIIQLVMNIGGGGGGGGGNGSKRDNNKNEPKKGKNEPETVSEEEAAKRKKKSKLEKNKENKENRKLEDNFDPDNPGFLKILVVDEDDNPVKGARIDIKPAFAKKRKGFWPVMLGGSKNKATWRKYSNRRTNADGFWPSRDEYAVIGSGTLSLDVTNHRSFKLTKKKQGMIELLAGETKIVIVTMPIEGGKADQFEPHVEGVKPTEDGNSLTLSGVIR